MARQSLRKRHQKNKAKIQRQYDHFQKLLRRQEIRLSRGNYKDLLFPEEVKKLRMLLWKELLTIPHGYKAVPRSAAALNGPRRAYYKICKILREAGGRANQAQTSAKIIVRRNTNALSSKSKNFDEPKATREA